MPTYVTESINYIGTSEAPFIQEMSEVTSNMWKYGWDERNGGNVSYILDEAEVAQFIDINYVLRTIKPAFPMLELAGKYFIVTGSGKYFKNVVSDPELNLGVVRVSEDGEQLELLWGFRGNGVPTSELAAHFMSHIERLKADPNHRVVLHTHATNVIAMTFIHELEENKFTKTLWEMCTECIVVFPDGVGVIPWLVPGTPEIGRATAQKMQTNRVVVWPQHGIYGAGQTMDEAFGLIETVEKAAQIYMLIAPHSIKQRITESQLRSLAEAFGVNPKPGVLTDL